MTITKCDFCKKEIRDERHGAISIALGAYALQGATICLKCSKPVLPFMKKHKLLSAD
jgi:hypothetical protein